VRGSVHAGAWVSAKIQNWKAGVYSILCLQSAKEQTEMFRGVVVHVVIFFC
jgi:hypothetical protein